MYELTLINGSQVHRPGLRTEEFAEEVVMAKKGNKRPITTEEALRSLLGRKAAKRLRRLALQVAKADRKAKPGKKKR